MKHTQLGRAGLKVSRLALGTVNFGPQADEADSYAIQGGGLTPQGRARREQIRFQAVRCFGPGVTRAEAAANCASPHHRWPLVHSMEDGRHGRPGLQGTGHTPRLDSDQTRRLEDALFCGPATRGWAGQRWILARIRALIGTDCTLPGVWYLLHRLGWSCQKPARRAAERDEGAIEVWKKDVWPAVNRPWWPPAPGSSSRASPAAS